MHTEVCALREILTQQRTSPVVVGAFFRSSPLPPPTAPPCLGKRLRNTFVLLFVQTPNSFVCFVQRYDLPIKGSP